MENRSRQNRRQPYRKMLKLIPIRQRYPGEFRGRMLGPAAKTQVIRLRNVARLALRLDVNIYVKLILRTNRDSARRGIKYATVGFRVTPINRVGASAGLCVAAPLPRTTTS